MRDDGGVLRRRLAPVALLLAIACTAHSSTFSTASGLCAASTVTFAGGATVHVDVASDDEDRARGLMGITDLPANQGMAFVWGGPTDASFWMKDTLIPLSIAFVDDSRHVVTIQEMTPCTVDPCDTYEASTPYVMAVEANAGWFGEHGIEVGDGAVLREAGCV
jgi:uncharacterized membrane protein (UPF0127 family)